MVHPDKRLDMPQARDAFEEVKKAYQVSLLLLVGLLCLFTRTRIGIVRSTVMTTSIKLA